MTPLAHILHTSTLSEPVHKLYHEFQNQYVRCLCVSQEYLVSLHYYLSDFSWILRLCDSCLLLFHCFSAHQISNSSLGIIMKQNQSIDLSIHLSCCLSGTAVTWALVLDYINHRESFLKRESM